MGRIRGRKLSRVEGIIMVALADSTRKMINIQRGQHLLETEGRGTTTCNTCSWYMLESTTDSSHRDSLSSLILQQHFPFLSNQRSDTCADSDSTTRSCWIQAATTSSTDFKQRIGMDEWLGKVWRTIRRVTNQFVAFTLAISDISFSRLPSTDAAKS